MTTKTVGTPCTKYNYKMNLNELANVDSAVFPTSGTIVIGNGLEFTTLELASSASKTKFVTDLIGVISDETTLNNLKFRCDVIDWDNCPDNTIPASAIAGIDLSTSFEANSLPTSTIDWQNISQSEINEIISNSVNEFDTTVDQNILTGTISFTNPSGDVTEINMLSTDPNNLIDIDSNGRFILLEPDFKLP